MALKYLVGIDLNKNELRNARIHNVSGALPTTGVEPGQIYYHTDTNKLFFWNGTNWIDASATDLSQGTRTTTSVNVNSSNGGNATLSAADATNAGIMSAADKVKLDGIATNANNYSHPTGGGGDRSNLNNATVINGITVNAMGHVTATTIRDLTPADINASAVGHGHANATEAQDGFMSKEDKEKLDDVANNANNYSHPNHTGDVTSTGDGATTIVNGAVTNAKMDSMAENTIKGRVTSAGAPQDLTPAQVRTMINVENGAQANVGTNLDIIGTGDTRTITSSTGTNVTVPVATTATAGWMSVDDKSKLNGIANNANNYAHPNDGGGSQSDLTDATVISGITVNDAGHVTGTTTRDMTSADVGAAPSTHVGSRGGAHSVATTSENGFMSSADKSKLSGIASNATANTGTVTSVSAGDGMDFTTIASSGAVTLGLPSAITATSTNNVSSTSHTHQIDGTIATKAYVDGLLGANDAMIFKGTIGAGGTVTALPTTHSAGWTYKVITAGTYAGKVCEVGDMIIAIANRSGTGNTNADWAVVQANIDGAVVGPSSVVNNRFAAFDGVTGKLIKDSGYSHASFAPATHDHNGHHTRKYTTTLGASTAVVVTHGLGTRDLVATVRETSSPYAVVMTDIEFTTTNTATVRFATAPASGAYTITLVG